jgi:hypothetical protein
MRFETGQRMAAIVRTASLNSPDRVVVTAVKRRPGSTRIELEILRYIGPMAANVPWFALIRVEIGLPKAGANEIVVCETTFETTDPQAPRTKSAAATNEERVSFLYN